MAAGTGRRGGLLAAVAGAVLARPPAGTHGSVPPPKERAELRAAQREAVLEEFARYNHEVVVCLGVPFGHTRPQWVLPYGGKMRFDGRRQAITADYS